MYFTKIEVINLSKKKKEHVTFDRMSDKRIRINKKAFIINENISKKLIMLIEIKMNNCNKKRLILYSYRYEFNLILG